MVPSTAENTMSLLDTTSTDIDRGNLTMESEGEKSVLKSLKQLKEIIATNTFDLSYNAYSPTHY